MQALKQQRGDMKCLGFAAAMACDSNISDFESFLIISKSIFNKIKLQPPWTDYELYLYLLYKGKYPAAYFQFDGYEEENSSLQRIDNNFYIQHINYLEKPAILTVSSEINENSLHVVYYDGFKIYDPNPNAKDGRPLSDYDIKEWLIIN